MTEKKREHINKWHNCCEQNTEHLFIETQTQDTEGKVTITMTCPKCQKTQDLADFQRQSFENWLFNENQRRYNTTKNYKSQITNIPPITLFMEENELIGLLNQALRLSPMEATLAALRKYLEFLYETFDYSDDPILMEKHRRLKLNTKSYLELPHSIRQNRKSMTIKEMYVAPEVTYQLLKKMVDDGDFFMYLSTLVFYDSGARPIEFFGNIWGNIDVVKGVMYVPETIAKTHVSRRSITLLIPETVVALKKWAEDNQLTADDPIFGGFVLDKRERKEDLDFSKEETFYKFIETLKGKYNYRLKKYCKQIGFMPSASPSEYWWRHTRITQLIKQKDMTFMLERFGHTDSKMMMRHYLEAGKDMETTTLEDYVTRNNLQIPSFP
jgi:integrase